MRSSPAQRACVNVAYVQSVLCDSALDCLDRHHRTFGRNDTVERQSGNQELQNGVGHAACAKAPERVINAADHATPSLGQQDQREDHAQRPSPVRQRGEVVQMVATRPYIDEISAQKCTNRQTVE